MVLARTRVHVVVEAIHPQPLQITAKVPTNIANGFESRLRQKQLG
jgi:hypothetical protein